jgi:uncharacterized protein YbjT (DUF2867 family)
MTTSILVTGGTGTLGRRVLPRLQQTGARVSVLTRSAPADPDGIAYVRGDLDTGEGLPAAVRGVEVVLHLAGSAKGDAEKARQLVSAMTAAGRAHLVLISVVGAERIPVVSGLDRAMFGYFAAKRGAEQVVAGSGLPWTTLRATQFHDLTLATAQALAKLPVAPVAAGFRFQTVETDEVAARLVELALGEPAGLVPDLGGPRAYGMDDLVQSYLRAAGRRRPLLRLRLPGQAARAIREGANLVQDGTGGGRSWEEFLAERVTGSTAAAARR